MPSRLSRQTIQLQPGYPLEVQVRNQGKPIEEPATVCTHFRLGEREEPPEVDAEMFYPSTAENCAETDSEGVVHFPDHWKGKIWVQAESRSHQFEPVQAEVPTDSVVVMKATVGTVIQGRVFDPEGRPARRASVVVGDGRQTEVAGRSPKPK